MGDGWWGLAEKQDARAKKQIQARAGYWYRQALPQLQGLTKDKVEKRLKEVPLLVANAATARIALFIKTPTVGGNGGSPFEGRGATPLVGFNITQASVSGVSGPIIKSLQPVYLGSSGTPSRTFGIPVGAVVPLLAKPGYAVGEIYARGGVRVNALKVGFMRIKGNSLDPKDRYESPWVGGAGGNAEVHLGGEGDAFQVGKPVGVKGKMVIGVWGRCANDVDCLGLIQSYSIQAGANIGTGEPTLGKWTWRLSGEVVEFQADGSCFSSTDATKVGKWVCVDKKTGRYQILWPSWGINRMMLSEDGTTLTAKSFLSPDNLTLAWNWTRNVGVTWTGKKIQVQIANAQTAVPKK